MVYVTRKIPDEALNYLARHCAFDLWPSGDRAVPRPVLLEKVRQVQGLYTLLTERIDEEVMRAAPNLKIIANMAVGYDNIDIGEATRRGIMVTNTPDVLTESTADLTFALILAAARRILEGNRIVLDGGWQTWSPMFLAGLELHGSCLGIIGLGRIGQAVARRARGFGMEIVYYSSTRRPQLEKEMEIQYCPLDELLRRSDIVSLHTPYNPGTYRLIGSAELKQMKKTAILINTSRGTVVDQSALYEALVSGQIWGAGLDVFEKEPIPPGDPLLRLPNVVALPHIGSATVKTRTAMAMLAAKNLVAGLQGEKPPNLVNRQLIM